MQTNPELRTTTAKAERNRKVPDDGCSCYQNVVTLPPNIFEEVKKKDRPKFILYQSPICGLLTDVGHFFSARNASVKLNDEMAF